MFFPHIMISHKHSIHKCPSLNSRLISFFSVSVRFYFFSQIGSDPSLTSAYVSAASLPQFTASALTNSSPLGNVSALSSAANAVATSKQIEGKFSYSIFQPIEMHISSFFRFWFFFFCYFMWCWFSKNGTHFRWSESIYLSFAARVHRYRFGIDIFTIWHRHIGQSVYRQTNEFIKMFRFCFIW